MTAVFELKGCEAFGEEIDLSHYYKALHNETYVGRSLEHLLKMREIAIRLGLKTSMSHQEVFRLLHYDGKTETEIKCIIQYYNKGIRNSNRLTWMKSLKKTKSCGFCQDPAILKCRRCKSVYYCTKDHQTAHWMTHKEKCAANI
jgi:hypothetical protein